MRRCAATVAALALAACTGSLGSSPGYDIPTGGSPTRGREIVANFHCGGCHAIPGVDGAHGVVGPSLAGFGRRTFIAGEVPNAPRELIRWLRDPHAVETRTAMPALGITEQQAKDIAAFLYTLRQEQ